jgi:hypothetical protein
VNISNTATTAAYYLSLAALFISSYNQFAIMVNILFLSSSSFVSIFFSICSYASNLILIFTFVNCIVNYGVLLLGVVSLMAVSTTRVPMSP